MRRLLKAVLARTALCNFSTLENEVSVDEIKATYEELGKYLDKK